MYEHSKGFLKPVPIIVIKAPQYYLLKISLLHKGDQVEPHTHQIKTLNVA